MRYASDLIELSLFQHAQSEKAVFVSENGDAKKGIWLPKSQIEVEDYGVRCGRTRAYCVTVTLPEWLAKDKGLI